MLTKERKYLFSSTRQGLEPPNFTGHFGVWDEERWDPALLYAEAETEVSSFHVHM